MAVFFWGNIPHNPLYGIRRENIAERLTPENWESKAIMRRDREGWLYLWVARGNRLGANRQVHLDDYFAQAWPPSRRAMGYEARFKHLDDALRYVNGEDAGLIATQTRPPRSLDEIAPELLEAMSVAFRNPNVIMRNRHPVKEAEHDGE